MLPMRSVLKTFERKVKPYSSKCIVIPMSFKLGSTVILLLLIGVIILTHANSTFVRALAISYAKHSACTCAGISFENSTISWPHIS